jgi:peptidyl-prolyl cis-trans isomerase B (cyclophilin B)
MYKTIQLAAAAALCAVFAGASSAGAKEVAVIETTLGTMTAELYTKEAPVTTKNFIDLSKKGFYNGVKFHRIIKGFMVQTGDPYTKKGAASTWGTGNSGTFIKDEFSSTLKHTKGVLSMANTGSPNSQSSQFFIMLGSSSHLDGKYSAFGKITRGLDVLDRLGAMAVKDNGRGEVSLPARPPVIKKITIKTQ